MSKKSAVLMVLLLATVSCLRDNYLALNPLHGFPCYGFFGASQSFFQLKALNNTTYSIPIPTFEYNKGNWTGEVIFNPCGKVDQDSECAAQNVTSNFGFIKIRTLDNVTKKCSNLIQETQKVEDWSVVINKPHKNDFVGSTLAISQKNQVATEANPFRVNFTLACDDKETLDQTKASMTATGGSGGDLAISASSKRACAVRPLSLVTFFIDWWSLALIGAGLSIFLAFYGHKAIQRLVSVVIMIVGILISLLVTLLITLAWLVIMGFNKINDMTGGGGEGFNIDSNYFVLIIMASLMLGLGLAWCLKKSTALLPVALGGFTGFLIGNFFFALLVALFGLSLSGTILFLFSFMFVGTGIYCGCKYRREIYVISTSFGGGFGAWFCFGCYWRTFPDYQNYQMYKDLGGDAGSNIWKWMVIFALLIITTGGLGFYKQWQELKSEPTAKGESDGLTPTDDVNTSLADKDHA